MTGVFVRQGLLFRRCLVNCFGSTRRVQVLP